MRVQRDRRQQVVLALAGLVVVAALSYAIGLGQGGDTGSDEAKVGPTQVTPTSVGVTRTTVVTTSPTVSSTVGRQRPSTVAQFEALWADERQAIIDELSQERYGLGPDGVLRGPGGFRLDTNQCPADWSNTGGIDGDTATIVHMAPLSALTTVGDLTLGVRTYLQSVNARGGIGPDGIRIEVDLKDDGYVPAKTRLILDELLPETSPFAISTIGGPSLIAVADRVGAECLPLLMGANPTPADGDPAGHPWITGLRMAQTTEVLLWVDWIRRQADEPVTVAALVMDNSFGLTYEQAFEDAVRGVDEIAEFTVVRHDPQAPSVAQELVAIADAEPDVFIAMTAGNPCLLALQEASRVRLAQTASMRFLPSHCRQPEAYVIPAGEAADGWLVMDGGVMDPTDPRWEYDPWVSKVNQELESAGVDAAYGLQGEGYGFRGWAFEQVLEIAASLPDGLTRTNLMLAQRGLREMTHPMLHDGVRFAMYGTEDAFFVEGSELARFDVATERWVAVEVIDIDGRTQNCSWAPETGCSS